MRVKRKKTKLPPLAEDKHRIERELSDGQHEHDVAQRVASGIQGGYYHAGWTVGLLATTEVHKDENGYIRKIAYDFVNPSNGVVIAPKAVEININY